MEIWKTEGMPDGYSVSNYGRFKNSKGKILKQQKKVKSKKNSYLHIKMAGKTYISHILVGVAFVDNPLNLPTINHKDTIKDNNFDWNLEWLSYSDNLKHAYRAGTKIATNSREVVSININTGIKTIHKSSYHAASETNSQQPNIVSCCQGKRITHNGYKFSYNDETQHK